MIQDMYHINPNNLEVTFMKLSERIHYFIMEFIDVWQQFAESCCFVSVTALAICFRGDLSHD